MSSLRERIGHFLRWFFNASPTAVITPPPLKARQRAAQRHRFEDRPQRASR
jgi:hypothetical protein